MRGQSKTPITHLLLVAGLFFVLGVSDVQAVTTEAALAEVRAAQAEVDKARKQIAAAREKTTKKLYEQSAQAMTAAGNIEDVFPQGQLGGIISALSGQVTVSNLVTQLSQQLLNQLVTQGINKLMNKAQGSMSQIDNGFTPIYSPASYQHISRGDMPVLSNLSCAVSGVSPQPQLAINNKVLASPVVGMRAIPIAGGGSGVCSDEKLSCNPAMLQGDAAEDSGVTIQKFSFSNSSSSRPALLPMENTIQ